MSSVATPHPPHVRREAATADLDVLVVGAGLSGVGAACRLREAFPHKRIAIVEARERIGGTWDLFRYPGVRSDSDMFTLGYPFRPWDTSRSIATGDQIRDYVEATAKEYGVDELIRFRTRVTGMDWSSRDLRWTVTTSVTDDRGTRTETCTAAFVYLCSGYYRYESGYDAQLPGIADFFGTVVHPQLWPEDLDYAGKKVVVVGSGATAMTIVPAMTDRAEHVTMLQRTPTYVVPMPAVDAVVGAAQRHLPPRAAAAAARAKSVLSNSSFYQVSQRWPQVAKRSIRRLQEAQLDDPSVIDQHFTPPYGPWDQRVCLVPDGDLFAALNSGAASVVTDQIETFVPDGIRLRSGRVLEADIVVTATGLEMQILSGLVPTVDGEPVDLPGSFVYRGTMISGLPNAALSIGYVNASWTLRSDLAARYLVRLLRYMDKHAYAAAVPVPPAGMQRTPLLPLSAGYIQRAADRLPAQGDRAPWLMRQNYALDAVEMLRGSVARGMAFTPRRRNAG